MAYVYRHIRLDRNEPFYIGIGNDENYKRAYNFNKRSEFWKNIFNKTRIDVDILLDNVSYDYAKEKEMEFISIYGRIDKSTGTLVNLTHGGDGSIGRIESLKKRKIIGDTHRGVPKSEETKRRISLSNMGKKITEETRVKLIKSHLGKKRSNESLLKLSKSLKGKLSGSKNPMYKGVISVYSNGILINKFDGVGNCSKFMGIPASTITYHLKRESEYRNKYIFKRNEQ